MKRKIFLFLFLVSFGFLFADDCTFFSLPGQNWAAAVDFSGFSVIENTFDEDILERQITLEAGKKITGMMEISCMPGSSDELCREFIVQQDGIVTALQQGKIADLTYVYYDLEMLNGELLKGFACFLGESGKNAGIYLLAHENAASFLPASRRILLSFEIRENYQPSVEERLLFGKCYFEHQDFFSALDFFDPLLQNQLLLESLPDEDYKILMNLASSAYNITGSPEEAIALLEEGLMRLPEDPLLYYNLASIYALYGMEGQVLDNLEKAYRFRVKTTRVASIPDPFKDSAFQLFLMNTENHRRLSDLVDWFAVP